MKKYLSILAAMAVVLSLSGCSSKETNGGLADGGSLSAAGSPTTLGSPTAAPGSSAASGSSSASGSLTAPSSSAAGSSSASSGEPDKTVKSDEYAPTDIGGTEKEAGAEGVMDGVFAEAEMADLAGAIDVEPGIILPEEPSVSPQAGLLTGGEWNDNAHWADWNALYSSHTEWNGYKSLWDVKDSYRLTVTVTAKGTPLEGALVSCGNCGSAVTDNKGKAYLFSNDMPGSEVTVTFQNQTQTMLVDWVPGVNDLTLSYDFGEVGNDQEQKSLDLMIMCDTTGSMGDELEYLKVELESIVRKIKSDNANIPTNISVNFYRDEGDEYVVRQFPFTDDIEEAAKAIKEQRADGGGDFPEAVHTALDSAVNNHDWSENSVKIMFLVLDAPPHEDAQIIDSVNKYVRQAAEMGIRIIPIASSGIDKSTEYLLRTMAFTTGGTYAFLTDDSGVGGSHLEPTIGAYNVEKLSDMMVRIVNGYLK